MNKHQSREIRRFVLLFVLVLSVFAVVPFSAKASPPAWSSFHGADYLDKLLYNAVAVPPPSISFPEMENDYGFNFIRVPLSWSSYSANSTAFLDELRTVANQAGNDSISVLYDFASNKMAQFPTIVQSGSKCPTNGNSCFQPRYMSDAFDVGSQTVWSYQLADFWVPVIVVVDRYPSTVGYELLNEPPVAAQPTGNAILAAYHKFFADNLRTLTAKDLIFGSANFDGNPNPHIAPPQADCTGSYRCVIDVHLYANMHSPSTLSSWASTAKSMGDPIFLGEFAPCVDTSCPTSTDTSFRDTVTAIVESAHANGLGMAYWVWRNASLGSRIAKDTQSLLNHQGLINLPLVYLAHAYNGILGATISLPPLPGPSPSVDSYVTQNCSSSELVSCSMQISTSGANEVVLVYVFREHGTSSYTVNDAGNLNWFMRDSSVVFKTMGYSVFYAVSPSQLTTDTVQVKLTVPGQEKLQLIAVGVAGANTSTIFDAPTECFASGGTAVGGTQSCSVNVSDGDLVVGFAEEPSGATGPTPGGGVAGNFTKVVSSSFGGLAELEYAVSDTFGTISWENLGTTGQNIFISGDSIAPAD